MPKVLVGMSGGLDSSVVALLLKEQGYDLIGAHMHFWSDKKGVKETDNKCCSLGAVSNARSICEKLDIPFYVLEIADIFKEKIVDYFIEKSAISTPNPCVMCNRYIKFGAFMNKAKELNCDYVATGHYARIKEGRLFRGKDIDKDQSYFMNRLSSKQLSKMILPIGDLTKDEVRKIAAKNDIFIKHRKESQDLCFYGEKQPKSFLKRYVDRRALQEGYFIDIESGKKLGKHDGMALYTVGQRKGLFVGGQSEALYVIEKDIESNLIYLGPQKYLNFIGCYIRDPIFRSKERSNLRVQVRYKSKEVPCMLKNDQIIFDKAISAVCPGQSAVLYSGDECIGGGVISKAIPQLSWMPQPC